jgi:dTDP-4-dehydrorhamnose reductase
VRLLLTGADGQVGFELRRTLELLGEVVALDRNACDLSHPELLPDIVHNVNPDIIVNAAAYTAVDQAEREEELATTVNGVAPGVLAEQARARGVLFVHYSTDYVFDGTKASPYLEADPPHPINAYGRSKLAGEAAIGESGAGYLIFRSSWVYAARGRNFVRTVLRLAAEKEELPIVSDQVGTPNWARHLAGATADAVGKAVAQRRAGSFSSGIFHLTASGAASWYDFACAIVDEARANGLLAGQRLARLRPIPSEDYPTPAARPRNSRLSGEKVRERFGITLLGWRPALGECLEEIKTAAP